MLFLFHTQQRLAPKQPQDVIRKEGFDDIQFLVRFVIWIYRAEHFFESGLLFVERGARVFLPGELRH